MERGRVQHENSKPVRFVLCLLVSIFAAAACSRANETAREEPNAARRVASEAAGGAPLKSAGLKTGASIVAGGLFGGLGRGLIGQVLEGKKNDYASTAIRYNYRPAQVPLVRLEDVAAEPSLAAASDTVHLITRYAVLPSYGDEPVTVRERWKIIYRGRIVGSTVVTSTRGGGTWSSAVPLIRPADAESGIYRARVEIDASGARDRGVTMFVVG